MIEPASVSRLTQAETRRWWPLPIFATWFALVLLQAARHAMWRDEVRALTLALHGGNIVAMLGDVHGEGHPALWYLLLRVAHALIGSPAVLPAVALMVAATAALLLVLKSPFPWPVICLILLSHFFLFEFSVMARNYGISMLILFIIAIYYPTCRHRSIVLGALLFLLANTNVHSAILVCCFLLFWLVDLLQETGVRWSRPLAILALNAVIAALGVVACFLTIYPTYNDLFAPDWSEGIPFWRLVRAVLDPAWTFTELIGKPDALVGHVRALQVLQAAASLLLFGSTLGLVGRPGAFLAALAALIAYSVFFAFVYGAEYRHEATWLAFLISLYWICWDQLNWTNVVEPAVTKRGGRSVVEALGIALFFVLLGAQINRVRDVKDALVGGVAPRSRSADFAAFLAGRPDLRDAILIADPDYLLEALPYYYLDNKMYLMRDQRYGNFMIFTKKSRINIGLDDVLQSARTIHDTTGKPVVILLQLSLDKAASGAHEEIVWTLTTTALQVQEFRDATVKLHSFRPAQTDESFDAYLLK